eukprot:1156419-Pelagomonas_calceolata.AAC.3
MPTECGNKALPLIIRVHMICTWNNRMYQSLLKLSSVLPRQGITSFSAHLGPPDYCSLEHSCKDPSRKPEPILATSPVAQGLVTAVSKANYKLHSVGNHPTLNTMHANMPGCKECQRLPSDKQQIS